MNSLINRAYNIGYDEFAKTVNNVIEIHRKERLRTSLREGYIQRDLLIMPPKGRAVIVGDIHGDRDALVSILKHSGFHDRPSHEDIYIFMGDYGDRGQYSPEVYYTLLSLKESHPENFILMRGNHEGPENPPCYPYDLPSQFNDRFGEMGDEAHKAIQRLFKSLYLGAIVQGKYLILHGGVPSEAELVDDIANAFQLHPAKSHLTEILWNDPRDEVQGTRLSPRGAGKLFGEDVTDRILTLTETKVLIRGHEAVQGTRVNHHGKVLTVFSCKAPYLNPTAAYLNLNLSSAPVNGSSLASVATYV